MRLQLFLVLIASFPVDTALLGVLPFHHENWRSDARLPCDNEWRGMLKLKNVELNVASFVREVCGVITLAYECVDTNTMVHTRVGHRNIVQYDIARTLSTFRESEKHVQMIEPVHYVVGEQHIMCMYVCTIL